MGGGGIKQSQSALGQNAAEQKAQGAALSTQGQGLINEGQAEQSPMVNFLKSIIGGNSTTTNQAIAPVLGNITANTKATREHIFDTIGPGAGRDVALGQNLQNQGSQVAGATNSAFLSAFPQLASLAGANTNAGLGLTGAGITSLGNSTATTGNILNSQEQQKAATMSAFGQLAGAAGSALGGGSLGKIVKGF